MGIYVIGTYKMEKEGINFTRMRTLISRLRQDSPSCERLQGGRYVFLKNERVQNDTIASEDLHKHKRRINMNDESLSYTKIYIR